jgi:hypothetical protein
MLEAALYILTGLALYAGAHHLYLGIRHSSDARRHLPQAAGYVLVSGLSLACALNLASGTPIGPPSAGQLELGLALGLWTALVWYVAVRCAFLPLIFLDLLTSAWLILLIHNAATPEGLLSPGAEPASGSATAGTPAEMSLHAAGPWWSGLEMTVLVSLLFCAYACLRAWRRGDRAVALPTASGLGLLALVSLHDHFVAAGTIDYGFMMPFGFALFLLPASLFPLLVGRRRATGPQTQADILSYLPGPASFHSDVADLRSPPQPDNRISQPGKKVPAGTWSAASPVVINAVRVDAANNNGSPGQPPAPLSRPRAGIPAPALDRRKLTIVTDNLIDIAVYATMALNRFKSGQADPRTLEALCRRIRSQAINTRRLAHDLEAPVDSHRTEDDSIKPD